ncbi:hypothetical protein [uncultured Albimonas sp.]|mgnify:CR=1 FL=1|uniref:hypothetical protein n=1 Tax=uncultured Albimonas sp. TaxID=1331701 RepID=UPI0030EC5265|tara:strand:+ start:4364 stop:4933 length:570 start_codon:yes stop_codon:yes gene_type:complete
MGRTDTAEALRALIGMDESSSRRRAAWWHLGLFVGGPDAGAPGSAARLALDAAVGPVAHDVEAGLLGRLLIACGALREAYVQVDAGDWAVDPARLPQHVGRLPGLVPELVRMQIDERGRWSVATPEDVEPLLGRIVVDGIEAAVGGLPVRACLHCGSIFVGARRDAIFCSTRCRSGSNTRRHRAREKSS